MAGFQAHLNVYHSMAAYSQVPPKPWQGGDILDLETGVPTTPRTPQSDSSGDCSAAPTTFALLEPKWLALDSAGLLQVVDKSVSSERTKESSPAPAGSQESMIGSIAPPPGVFTDGVVSPPPGSHLASLAEPVVTPEPKAEMGPTNTIAWVVDARKLSSDHKVLVSPSFELALAGRIVSFKVFLTSREVTSRKGGHSFKKSRGIGSLQLKCETLSSLTDSVDVTFSVGSGFASGSVVHDFAQTGICSLKGDRDNLDFTKAVDRVSQSFEICVQIQPRTA